MPNRKIKTLPFNFSIYNIDSQIFERIKSKSWKNNNYIQVEDLSYLTLLFRGFDDKIHLGEMIVNKMYAKEVIEIFKILLDNKFQIEKMVLIDEYFADDKNSMKDNNTYSFCYRYIDGSTKLSKHSMGIAIDINPVQNPYIKDEIVLPQEGISYINRTKIQKGMILENDECVRAFRKYNWSWGGYWKDLKDFQHFEKN